MEKVIKLIESLSSVLKIIAVVFLLYILNELYEYFKSKTTPSSTTVASTSLIAQTEINNLITSKASIDMYFFFTFNGEEFVQSGESLADFAGEKRKLEIKKGDIKEEYRQYCQINMVVTFGYEKPFSLANKIISREENSTFLPTVLAIEIVNRTTAPTDPRLITKCGSIIRGGQRNYDADNIVVKNWLRKDDVLEHHFLQGIENFFAYANYIAGNNTGGKTNVMTWRKSAIDRSHAEMKDIQTAFFSASAKYDRSSIDKFFRLDIHSSKTDAKEKINISPQQTSLPNISSATYLETYSTLVYSNVQKNYFIFMDQEYAIQRDVASVVYGIETIGGQFENNIEIVIASEPQILYKNTASSEIGLFNDKNFDQFRKTHKKSVDQFMSEQIKNSMDAAIIQQAPMAKQSAKKSFENHIRELMQKRNQIYSIQYVKSDKGSPASINPSNGENQ